MRAVALLAPLLAGLAALVAGTLFGWQAGILDALVEPPPLVRGALVAGATVLGVWLLGRAIGLIDAARGRLDGGPIGALELRSLVRGVRLAFLAVAAFAAGTGWLLAHPLPIVLGLVIAGVDVLETSFLLLVVALRERSGGGSGQA